MVLTDSSIGKTTWVVTSSDVAPGSLMLMVTVAGSALGNRSTPRSLNEKTPSTTRKVMSITANTGRFTHSSASVIWTPQRSVMIDELIQEGTLKIRRVRAG